MADSKPVVHHLDLVSLRGPEYPYVFSQGRNGIPDCTDWHARRVYMDSFILYAIPVTNEDISNNRTRVTVELFKALMTDRLTWVADDWLNCVVDLQVWTELFTQYAEPDRRPEFPWKRLPHDESKPASLMYRSWRESLNLESDITGPIRNSIDSKDTMNAIEALAFEDHSDLLRTCFPDLQLAYGIEPTLASGDGHIGPDLSHPAQSPLVLPAPQDFASSALEVPCVDHAGQSQAPPADQSEPTKNQSEPPDFSSLNIDDLAVHPGLLELWDVATKTRNCMGSLLVVSPFEIRLPPPLITNLILPTRTNIYTLNMPGKGLLYIQRRSETSDAVTIGISLTRAVPSELSREQADIVEVAWKCIVRWVTVIYCIGMVPWETWEFLWANNLFDPMMSSNTLNDAHYELSKAEYMFRETLRNTAENSDKDVAMASIQAMQAYLEKLAEGAALNRGASETIVDMIRHASGNSYGEQELVLNSICEYVSSFKVKGRPNYQVDAFFQISALAIYTVANSPLEDRQATWGGHFPVASTLARKLQGLA